MSAGTLIPVEEYLNTSYRPDCDYVEGVLLERNVGEWDRGRLQGALCLYFHQREKILGLLIVLEQRAQVKSDRFRVPDVCLVRAARYSQSSRTRPYCALKCFPGTILSAPCRRASTITCNSASWTVWLIDPQTRRGFVYTHEEITEARGGIPRAANPGEADIELRMSELAE